ncbi:MAG: hypothetical protein ABH804_02930 [archaeon]
MVKKIKKRGKKSKPEKKVTGYTEDIKKDIRKVKKLYQKKIADEKRFEKNRKNFMENKEKVLKELENLKEKKKLEKENLTKLISYVKKK